MIYPSEFQELIREDCDKPKCESYTPTPGFRPCAGCGTLLVDEDNNICSFCDVKFK